MKKVNLTNLKIKNLTTDGSKRLDVWDAMLPGFGLRLSSSGTKSFILMYRFERKLRRHTIGRYPLFSLAQARSIAQDILVMATQGKDPLAKQSLKKNSKASKEGSFTNTLDSFLELHCMRHNKPSTIASTSRLLKKEFLPLWQDRQVAEISKGDILQVLDKIVERGVPGTANHAYSAISKFFSWCSERDIIGTNPCSNIKRPTKLNSRDRVLSSDELSRIWMAATEAKYPFGSIVQLLILTAQRRGEVTNMQWAHLKQEENIWDIPKELTKSNRRHVVPLSPAALSIIDNLPRLDEKFIFPSQGATTTVFSGFGKCKQRLDEMSGVSNWVLHDLRRTAATGMAELAIAPHVIERILNHASGTFAGVAGIYNRFGYFPEMHEALETWADHVLSLQH